MPNWVEGKLKIRGDKKDMATFFKEEMREVEYQNVPVTNSIKIDIDKDGDFVVEKIDFTHRFKLKNARHYITESSIDSFYSCCKSVNGKDVLVVGFEAAWLIDAEYFAEMSKKYDIDFKIYAFEQGKEFNQNLEVVAGKIIKDEVIEFDDYIWECIDPTIGG